MISTVGLSKAAVLAALFNASKQQGLGVLDPSGARSMSEDDAGNVLGEYVPHLCFDYIRGRVMKVDLSEDKSNSPVLGHFVMVAGTNDLPVVGDSLESLVEQLANYMGEDSRVVPISNSSKCWPHPANGCLVEFVSGMVCIVRQIGVPEYTQLYNAYLRTS